jgi:hypothetical protein
MTEIKVVNKYHIGGRPVAPPEGTVRAAVYRSTPLGNPFKMDGYSQAERDRVCDAYEQWLPPKLLQDGAELAQFQQLLAIARNPEVQTLELICHCAPKRCHGDTIKRLLEDQLGKGHGGLGGVKSV